MEMIIVLAFGLMLAILAFIVIRSLKQPGSRYRLKKDYGLTDREIDEKFPGTVTEKDLKALEKEKRKKDYAA